MLLKNQMKKTLEKFGPACYNVVHYKTEFDRWKWDGPVVGGHPVRNVNIMTQHTSHRSSCLNRRAPIRRFQRQFVTLTLKCLLTWAWPNKATGPGRSDCRSPSFTRGDGWPFDFIKNESTKIVKKNMTFEKLIDFKKVHRLPKKFMYIIFLKFLKVH